jgi:integrase
MNQLTGFLDIRRYSDGEKVIKPKLSAISEGNITIEEAFDLKIDDLENSIKGKDIKQQRTIRKDISDLKRNKIRVLSTIDKSTTVKSLNNIDSIDNLMQTASSNEWYTKGKGAGARNFFRDTSRVISYSIGKENNKFITFKNLQKGKVYEKAVKYTAEVAERAVVFNNEIFKTVVQSLDDIPDLQLENIPKGSTSRFAKIVSLTGMRPEYLAELKFEDIDFKNGTVKYKDFKQPGKPKITTVSVNKTSLALLQQQKNASIAHGTGGSRTLFVGTSGQYSKPINKHFKKIGAYVQLTDGGVDKFQLYDFRRLQKARLMANNAPQTVIDAMMGHSYKGPYAKGIMEAGITNADIRVGVANAEVDFYNRAGYSGDAIEQFSGSTTEGKPRVRIKAGTTPKDPPKPPLDPPATGGTTSTKQVVKKPVKNLAKKWGGRFLKYILPSLLSPQALTAEIVLQPSSTGKTIDEQINDLMTQNNVSKSEAIELFKENPPLEAAEGVYGIDPYEKQFKKQQEAAEHEKRVQENIKEISTKGLFKADLTLPEETRLSE